MQIKFNILDRHYKSHENEYMSAVEKVMKSGWYILGNEVENFEKKYSKYMGAKYCVGLNSGLDALILAIRALGIGKDDEVIVPANTYIATVLGITENGAKPVFVEPDEYYNLDVDKIEAAITKNTKAILVVHLYGQAANMEKIKEISEKYKLYLIEDCAQSHNAKFNGQLTGTFGDIGCFSFFPTKNFGAFGDAGAIVTNNEALAEKIEMLRNYGSKMKYFHEIEGVNSRLDEIQAALLVAKLTHLNMLTDERKYIASRYINEIKCKYISLPEIHDKAEHVFHLFVVRCENRDIFQKYLLDNNIYTQIHYPIPPHLSSAYERLGYKRGDFPVTEKYSNEVLSLPLYNVMAEKEIEYVIEVINKYKK